MADVCWQYTIDYCRSVPTLMHPSMQIHGYVLMVYGKYGIKPRTGGSVSLSSFSLNKMSSLNNQIRIKCQNTCFKQHYVYLISLFQNQKGNSTLPTPTRIQSEKCITMYSGLYWQCAHWPTQFLPHLSIHIFSPSAKSGCAWLALHLSINKLGAISYCHSQHSSSQCGMELLHQSPILPVIEGSVLASP